MLGKKTAILSILVLSALILSGCSSPEKKNNSSGVDYSDENDQSKTVVYFFWGDGCSLCEAQKIFFNKMKNKYPELGIKMFETWDNKENLELLEKMGKAYDIKIQGVPVTFIGGFEPLVGYSKYADADLERMIVHCLKNECPNPMEIIY